MVQVAPPAMEFPQSLVCWKSEGLVPPIAMDEMATAVEAEFVTVTALAALVVPTLVDENVRVLVETVIAYPVPDSVTLCGEVGSASLMVSVALRDAATCGVNVTVMVQLDPPAMDVPQVLVCWKSDALAPPIVIDETATAAEPALVTVTVLPALVVPTSVDVKLKLFADTVIAYPVPDSETLCGEVGSASLIVSVALSEAATSGANVTVMVQLELPARDVPQVFVCLKSVGFVPPIAIDAIATAAEPVFVTVTVLPVLVVPTIVELKLRLFADTVIAYPVPDRDTVCGEVGSESAIWRVALREPAA